MSDRVGQQLRNYRLIHLLASGGFADIYLGEHLHLKTQAAIKVLHASLASSDTKAFLQEAQIVAHLRHPHIIQVLDFDVENHVPFLVMEYLPDGSMRQKHAKGSQLPLSTIISYVKQIASALQYAHNMQVIHRDIKPENILLNRQNEVVLSDFGVAVFAQTLSSHSIQEIAGTAPYMAPEQFRGKPSRASDQYALAVMIYEWMSGNLPFHGSFAEIASQHLLVSPPLLHEKIPTIPLQIEEVVVKALAKEPEQRFASIQDFALALEQAYEESRGKNAFKSSPFARKTALVNLSRLSSNTNNLSSYATVPADTAIVSSLSNIEAEQPFASPSTATVLPRIKQPSPKLPVTDPSHPSTVHLDSATYASSTTSRKHISKKAFALLMLLLVLCIGSFQFFFPQVRSQILTNAASSLGITHISHSPVSRPSITVTNNAMLGFNPQHTHFNTDETILSPTNVSRLQLDWAVSTGGSGIVVTTSSPVIADGIVYIGSEDNKLYAFDTKSSKGKLLWSATTQGILDSSPAVVSGVVYVGSDDHRLYAFDAKKGTLLWSAVTGDTIYASPVVVDGIVYVGSDKMYAFDAKKGTLLWSANTNDPLASSPAVANGTLYIGSEDGNLYAFDAKKGTLLWQALTGAAIVSSPAVANGIVYVGSDKLYAFDSKRGKRLWNASTNDYIFSSPAVANGIVYIGSHDSRLYAFNAKNGDPLWSATTGTSINASPTVANGIVYIGSDELYAFDAKAGTSLWATNMLNSIATTPLVSNGVLYVGANHGLYAFYIPS